jgi:hypothetical protein
MVQNKYYVILIIYNQSDVITCLKCKVKFFNKKTIFIYLENLNLSKSQNWPTRVLQDIPNSASDLSHMVCPKFNSHVYKLKRLAKGVVGKGSTFVSILLLGFKEVLLLGSAQCSKKSTMDQSI